MISLVILRSRLLATRLAVQVVGRQVMHIHEGHAQFLGHLLRPCSTAARAAFHLATRPLVARRHAHDHRVAPLLAHIIHKLTQIPSVRVHHLIGAVLRQTVHMATILHTTDVGTRLATSNVAHVIMSKLNQHIVARFDAVIHLFPAALLHESARTASGHGSIHQRTPLRVKHRVSHATPAPHAVIILILILHRAVARKEHHRFALLTHKLLLRQLQRQQILLQCQSLTRRYSLSRRARIGASTQFARMYLVQIKHIVHLPRRVRLKLTRSRTLQVHPGHPHLACYLLLPFREGLTLASDGRGIVPRVARGQ